ncbi:hypothetical protein JCM11251_000195 [Rhodosporidiobolus azoricus]
MARLPVEESHDASRPEPFVLSAVLQGHQNDVRSVAPVAPTSASRGEALLSGGRDCTARLWERSASGWEERRSWRDEEGWVNCVQFLPARKGEEDQSGYLVCAGADSQVHLFPLSSASDKPAHTLLGHAHNVCALRCSTDGNRIVSASWDLTARVWTWKGNVGEGEMGGWDCENVLVGHAAAVWDVLLLEREKISVLTACADSRIRLFHGAQETRSFRGHEGPVRALAKLLPEDQDCALFASASNDSTIRIWNYQSGDQVTVLGTHDSFIYSLASLPSSCGGGLASSGEDGIIKVWNEGDGEVDQEILVPALSVWSLAALPNGDIACGCSDNLVWIFTRDEARVADQATTREYEGRLEERRSSKRAKETPAVAEKDALEQAGSKEGEVKLIRVGELTKAYQWDGSAWNEVGEVVDAPQPASTSASAPAPPRMVYDGTEYDYVFSIDVKDDEPPLQLPYNDDPHGVAEAFVKQHSLPESYLEQIVMFIRNSTA